MTAWISSLVEFGGFLCVTLPDCLYPVVARKTPQNIIAKGLLQPLEYESPMNSKLIPERKTFNRSQTSGVVHVPACSLLEKRRHLSPFAMSVFLSRAT